MTSGSEIWSWKQSEPSSLLAQEYAAALMRVTLGDFWGFTSRTGFGISGTGSRSFGSGANDGNFLTEGELLDLCCNGCQKKMLSNTQSIFWNNAVHKIFCTTPIDFRTLYDMGENNDQNPRPHIKQSSLLVLILSEGTGAHLVTCLPSG